MSRLDRRAFLAGGLAAIAAACSRGGSAGSGDPAPARPVTSPPEPTDTTTAPPTSAPTTAAPTTAGADTSPADRPRRWVAPVEQYPAAEPFGHGVASGEPTTTSVLLWTQVTTAEATGPVTATVASDPDLTDVVATRTAEPDHAGTVRLTVDGLATGREWFYRFERGGHTSPTGRATTLPGAGTERFVVALASCQHYEEGFFTALGDLADSAPDVVVHVGDFVYARRAAGPPVRALPGGHGPVDDDTVRTARYAGYLRDPHLQRARAAAPWLAVGDDNERRGGGDPDRTWRDHMPVGDGHTEHYRSLDIGDLARIVLVDTRTHRDPPVCDRVPGFGVAERCDALDAGDRTILGADQEAWLAGVLAGPPTTWTLVAGQVVVTDLAVDLAGVDAVNDDQWDGYPAARRRLFEQLAGVPGAVALSGDLHSAGLSTLRDDAGTVVGHEVLGPSVSSVVPAEVQLGLEVAALGQPDLEFFDSGHRGWVHLDVGRSTLAITYRRVDALVADAAATDGPAYDLGSDGRLRRR